MASMTDPWIPDGVWDQTLCEDAVHYDIISDVDLGTIAYTATADGTIITGSDPAYREDIKSREPF